MDGERGLVIGALRTAAANFRARRGMFLASGLAFNFMVGLIPVLFFFVSVAGFVLSRRTVMDAVLNQLSAIVPVYKDELHEALAAIIRRRTLSGLLGTAVLLVFASQLFNSIRVVLSDIFGFRGGPGFLRGMLRDMVMVVAMGVLFLGSLVISDVFGWLKILLFQTMGIPSQWVRSWSLALALTLSTAFFFVPYRYFPHRRVPVGAALAGALLAAVLWEAAKQLFRWYILSFGVYDQVYGPLGVLVALAMFAYYSGVVFILGAEFTAALMRTSRG
ncbi:MAG TPA: YihY/virulence factor BrkB family protein [Candidatus Eisenbacteria bacterium]|nr:YihY/virulence factor BrkB family protein [Candidatus Eisenbacteria bacterium]